MDSPGLGDGMTAAAADISDAAAALVAHRAGIDALVSAVERDAPSATVWPVALPPGSRIERVETHISTVLLAGGHALKLKKPVKLPFADFSTPTRREHFCREELRVNRRTAPGLYLDVLPLTGTPQAPRVGGGGPAFDWAVWMRRFDAAGLFDRLAREGRLTATHVDALAGAVAAFQAAQASTGATWGDPAQALRWALDTLAELRALVAQRPGLAPAARPALAAQIDALQAWTVERHAQIEPLLQRRRAAGAVIEGHGDLHLGNVVWHEGAPLLFDALEFEPALRHGDRYADIAFLFMDLLAHGLPALAWRALSTWLEHCGDHDGLPLLRWFAAYRALVRAKVALLTGGAQADATALRLVALAHGLAFPRRPAVLVVTCGLSGSGKSTVAQALVEALGAVRVRSDVERKRLHGLAPTQRPADPALLYNPASTARTYERLATAAAAALDGSVGVVVDAVFNRRAERDALRQLALGRGVDCIVVDCQAPEATLRERVVRRRAEARDASDADEAVLALQQRTREPPDPAEGPTLRLDTGCSLDTLRARVEAIAQALAGRSTIEP
jgi:aminoglycoside phosphotransferase family enzyme/predicted kinase